MKLTAKEVQGARWTGKDRELYDGNGLYLDVREKSRTWRYAFRVNSKQSTHTIGPLTVITLQKARELHREAYALVLDGINPNTHRRAQKQAAKDAVMSANQRKRTVEELKKEWLDLESSDWANSHYRKVELRLKKNLPKVFLKKSVTEVTPDDVLTILQVMENRGTLDLAHRVRSYLRRMFDHAKDKKIITENPVIDSTVKIKKRPMQTNYGHTTDIDKFAAILQAIDGFTGDRNVQAALKLLPLLFARPGELRGMKWCEVNFSRQRWDIPAERMKSNRDQVVPLSNQALDILADQKELAISDFVFPGRNSEKKPLSDNTFNMALRRLGFDNRTITSHGFRHIASTLLNEGIEIDGETHLFRGDAIERQLAHFNKSVRATYNKAEYLPERTEMMQLWADFLDEVKAR